MDETRLGLVGPTLQFTLFTPNLKWLAEPKLGAPRRLGAVARLRPPGLRRGSLLASLRSERRLVEPEVVATSPWPD